MKRVLPFSLCFLLIASFSCVAQNSASPIEALKNAYAASGSIVVLDRFDVQTPRGDQKARRIRFTPLQPVGRDQHARDREPGSAQTRRCKRGRAGGDNGKTAPTVQQLSGAGKRQHAVGVTDLRRLESGGLGVVVGVRHEQTDRLARRAPLPESENGLLIELVSTGERAPDSAHRSRRVDQCAVEIDEHGVTASQQAGWRHRGGTGRSRSHVSKHALSVASKPSHRLRPGTLDLSEPNAQRTARPSALAPKSATSWVRAALTRQRAPLDRGMRFTASSSQRAG